MLKSSAAAGAVRRSGMRPHAMTSVSALALLAASFAGIPSAKAQTPPPAQTPPASIDEIVVTGSRIVRDGYEAPTPVTVVGVEQIQQSGFPDLFNAVRTMPAFGTSGEGTRAGGNSVSSGRQGQNTFNLRNLGETRTLSLLNGHRIVSSDLNGAIDTNVFPQPLISRVDVVTGGASAAYGSDALAGVVNFVIDTEFTGVKGEISSGITTYGDDWTGKSSIAAGMPFAGGRGHVIASYDWNFDPGLFPMSAREWNRVAWKMLTNSAYGTGPGQSTSVPEFIIRSNTGLINASPGGIITAGPLKGTAFNKEGVPFQFIYPDVQGAGFIAGGMAPLNDTSQYSQNVTTRSRQENVFFRASYDLADNITLFGQFINHYSKTAGLSKLDDSQGNLTIRADNPFIPADVAGRMTALGLTSFTMGSFNLDIPNLSSDFKRRTWVYSLGLEGTANVMDKEWTWELFGQYSLAKNNLRVATRNNVLFPKAVDAVRNANGAIVCRVNADADPANDDPSCAPFNPFGNGAPSAEARAYTTGTQRSDAVSKLDAAAVRVQGDLFNLPAGPLSIAFGAEARWEEQDETVGELDAAGAFATPLYPQALSGGFNVKEGFVEALVPILKNDGFEVDFNGAARYSDYSLSGGIWSWKLGGTTRLFNDLLLRATRSRDIRAPNVGELFSQGGLNIRPIVDLDTAGRNDPNYNPNPTARVISGGNPDLVPEVSETLILGGSYTPSFVPGLQLSVDYYDISINRAIATVTPSDITAACAAGDQVACDAVVRDATGTITDVFATSQNLAKFETSGFDIEASYRIPQFAGLPGMMSFRALATYVDKLVTKTGTNTNDTAGDVGDAIAGLPNWRANFDIDYITEDFSLNARARYVGGGDFNDQLDIVNGKISARTYIDLGAEFSVMDNFTLFGNVRNLFDKDPPLVTTTYNAHYDVVGRFFTVGGRVNF